MYKIDIVDRRINVVKVDRLINVYAKAKRGLQGATGPKGDKGEKGDQGDPATNLVTSVNGAQGVVVLDTDDINDTAANRYTNDSDINRLANTSGTNTGDQDLTPYFNKSIDDSDDIAQGAINLFLTSAERTKLSDTSGVNTGDQNLSGLVPYTGATADVNLGTHKVTTSAIQSNSSAGGTIKSNSGANVAEFGEGGGQNITFEDGVKLNGGAASRILATDASKNIQYLDTATYPSLTELSYLKGTTGAIQTAVDSKLDRQSTTSPLSVYTVDSSGNQSTRQASSTVTSTGIAVLRGNGGIITGVTPVNASDVTRKDYVDNSVASREPLITSGTTSQYFRGDKTFQTLDKIAVGLTNVDNTSDASKPISTATQTALDDKLSKSVSDTIAEGINYTVGTVTGTQIATSTTQKLGFYGATPVVRQSATTDLGTALSNLGLRSSGTAYPLSTSGATTFSGAHTLSGQRRQSTASVTTTTTLTTSSISDTTVTASTAAINITLPATTTAGIVFRFLRLDNTAQVVTILGTINGATNYVLSAQYKYVELKSTTTSGQWQIWSNN